MSRGFDLEDYGLQNLPPPHRLFVALNGPVLDDRKAAFAGLIIVDYHTNDTWSVVNASFYHGASKGHAVQISPDLGTGYLGSFAATPIIFDLKDGSEVGRRRFIPWDANRPINAAFFNATHIVWGTRRSAQFGLPVGKFAVPIRDSFYMFDIEEFRGNIKPGLLMDNYLGFHNVPWPHAMKISASGRYILYGSLDYADGKPARCIGVFDLQTRKSHVVNLPATAWHVAVHPSKDIGYAVSQNYLSGTGKGVDTFDEYSLAINFSSNYVFRIDLGMAAESPVSRTACITAMESFAAHEPHHLSADIVSLGDDDDTIMANFCASAQNGVLKLNKHDFKYLDERVIIPGWRKKYGYMRSQKSTREILRTFMQNLADAGCIQNLPTNTHLLIQALRAGNKSVVEGSFGLTVNQDKTRCFSAHRGLNAILVYDMTKPMPWPLVTKIDLPKAYEILPKRLGISKHLGLGMHHMTSL